jgi:hypothetical protein
VTSSLDSKLIKEAEMVEEAFENTSNVRTALKASRRRKPSKMLAGSES